MCHIVLSFSVILVLRLPRLRKRELILVLIVRLFDLCLFGFVGFLFLLWSGKGCGLWLWHSLDFSLTFFFLTHQCYISENTKKSTNYRDETTMRTRQHETTEKPNFSEQIRKLINPYKWIGYSLDIMRQTACLVVNPVIVDGYASLFNCTTADRASDSMTAFS